MDLLSVLKALNPTDDSLWTDDGLPLVNIVKGLMGDDSITREDINRVALGLTRENVETYTPPVKAKKTAKQQAEEPVVSEVVEVLSQETLLVDMALVREEIAKVSEVKQKAEQDLLELNQRLFSIERQIIPVDDNVANAEAIAGYAAAAQAEREAKAEKIQKLLDSGVSLKEVQEIMGMNKRKRR